jgi:hypothetical protein
MRDARVTHQHDFGLASSAASTVIHFEVDHERREPIDKGECRGGLRREPRLIKHPKCPFGEEDGLRRLHRSTYELSAGLVGREDARLYS